jgi:hypothetical protein
MKLIALTLLALPLFSQSQQKLAPDCTQGNIVFSATGAWQSFDNRPQSNNTGIPCAFWSLTYVAAASITGITIEIDGSPDNSTWTSLVTSSLIPSGRLEWNGQTGGVASYYPWIRVKVTYGSGTGTINAVLNGWRANGVTIGGGTGGGGSGSPNSATAFTSATSVLIPGAGTPNVIVECYDNSTPARFKIQTNSESVSTVFPYNYTVTFSSNQSGVCVLNSSGGSVSGASVGSGAQYSMAYYPNSGTNPVVGPLPSGGSIIGPIGTLNPSGLAGAEGYVGNTTIPTLPPNSAGWVGPPVGSLTPYGLQLSVAAPTGPGPIIATLPSFTVTFTNSSAVIAGANTFSPGTSVQFSTTNTLPTNFALSTTYFVSSTGLSNSQFEVAATNGGTPIVAGSAGSGTQTVTSQIAFVTYGNQTGNGTTYMATQSPTATGTIGLFDSGQGATTVVGYNETNSTASTSGTTEQYSPAKQWCGTAYNSSSGLSETDCWRVIDQTITAAGTTSSGLAFQSSINGGAYVTQFTMGSGGRLTFASQTITGSSVLFEGVANSTGTYYACLGVVGTGALTYDTSTCGSSLLALKENIQDLGGAVAVFKLMQLRPVSFDWKEGSRAPDSVNGMRDIGMIADWTAAVDPLLGSSDKNGKLENWKDREVLTLAVKTIQEQEHTIERLESRIAALEAR